MRTECSLRICCPTCGHEIPLHADERRPVVVCPHCRNEVDIRDRLPQLVALDAISSFLDR